MAYWNEINLGKEPEIFSEFFKSKEKAEVVKKSVSEEEAKKKSFSVWKILENQIVKD